MTARGKEQPFDWRRWQGKAAPQPGWIAAGWINPKQETPILYGKGGNGKSALHSYISRRWPK